jgi:hypothetical protein
MGLFDKLKDKAADLADQAKDKVSDVTGIDVDKVTDVAGKTIESAEHFDDAADALGEARDRFKGE